MGGHRGGYGKGKGLQAAPRQQAVRDDAGVPIWQFAVKNDAWENFGEDDNAVLELKNQELQAHPERPPQVFLTNGKERREYNVKNMDQKNAGSDKVRQIRRLEAQAAAPAAGGYCEPANALCLMHTCPICSPAARNR